MDLLDGSEGDDILADGNGDNTIYGKAGNDRIKSGLGHDMIDGGVDDDVLTGAAGADAFMIRPDSGHDAIEDFDAGPGAFDHLAIDGLQADELALDEGEDGVRMNWSDGQGSVLLKGAALSDLAPDDSMFVEGPDSVAGLTPTSMLTDALFIS